MRRPAEQLHSNHKSPHFKGIQYYLGILSYLITLISNAVVWGGMLAVMKGAWRTLTRRPDTRLEKLIGLPKIFHISASSGTLNWMTLDKFPSLIVVKLLFLRSTFTILPIVTLSSVRRTTCMT